MTATARELGARFGLHRVGREWRGTCPACGYPEALTVTEQRGRALWFCVSCRDQASVTAALLGDAGAASPRSEPSGASSAGRKESALRLWAASAPAAGSLVDAYLASRGLNRPPDAPLRFLCDAKHPTGQRLPAMVALLHDADGKPCAIHRTFLAPGGAGKAKVEPPRMSLGPMRGAVCRLFNAADRLALGEGIESSLAAAQLLDLPAWAAISAGGVADAQLPPQVREVTLATDNDRPGRDAVIRAAARFKAEGRQVLFAIPDSRGLDFNDVLLKRRL